MKTTPSYSLRAAVPNFYTIESEQAQVIEEHVPICGRSRALGGIARISNVAGGVPVQMTRRSVSSELSLV